jgi:hypothetical protein
MIKPLQVANMPAASLPRLSQAVKSFVGPYRGATAANWRKPSKIAQARGSTSMALNGAPDFQFAVSNRLGLKDFAADFLVVARIPRDLPQSAQHRAARELLWSRPCRHPSQP